MMRQLNGHASNNRLHTGSSQCYLRTTPTLALPTAPLQPPSMPQCLNPIPAQIPLPDSSPLPILPPARRPKLTFMSWRGEGSCPSTGIHTNFNMLTLVYGRVTSLGVPSPLELAHDPWRAMIASWRRVKALALSVHLPVSFWILCEAGSIAIS